jgi:hypothetical protein
MSARGFRSVGWVAGVAATALGCYMVSLQVASTRASLEDVETQIVVAERDIRVLQTEIGTRGRLAQLENWNVKVLALSAPQADQFLDGGFALAAMVAPKRAIDPAAPVVLASAPALRPQPVLERVSKDDAEVPTGMAASSMLHVASLNRDLPDEAVRAPAPRLAAPAPVMAKPGKTAGSIPPARSRNEVVAKSTAAPKAAKVTTGGADKKAVDKLAPLKTASADTAGKAAKRKESPAKAVAGTSVRPTRSKEVKPKQ